MTPKIRHDSGLPVRQERSHTVIVCDVTLQNSMNLLMLVSLPMLHKRQLTYKELLLTLLEFAVLGGVQQVLRLRPQLLNQND